MPKKFRNENSKAAEARIRKETKKKEDEERREKVLEEEYWHDDDKHGKRKQERKENKEEKRMQQLERKLEARKLADDEMASIKSPKLPPPSKLTRAQIAETAAMEAAAAGGEEVPYDQRPLEENMNRLLMEDGAHTVEDAISELSSKEPELDKHPEKRMKAAYAAYEARRMPALKQENPNFRLSQLKQLLKKDWMKSPENPLNQRMASYMDK